MDSVNDNIISVKDLRTVFRTEDGTVRAVDGVSFTLAKGETLAIVGESGSGKSATGLSLMRLIPDPPGEIVGGEIGFDGKDLLKISEIRLREIRGKRIAMVFQDPMASLNPFLKISTQLMEVSQLHLGHSKQEARAHAVKMLELVGIPDAANRIDSYPHEFSGGMRQRVMIAMALSCNPEVLIADEATTALDVTIQAQILELLKDLKSRLGMSVILITHDLGVVAGMADRVLVMYGGRVLEEASAKDLFATPSNPYTKGLLRSIPNPENAADELYQIPGAPPDLSKVSAGCPFVDRCDRAQEICRKEMPPRTEVAVNHYSLCHFAEEVRNER